MNIVFGDEVIDCRHLEIKAGFIKQGDFIAFKQGGLQGGVFKVETIQRDCPAIENLHHLFINFVLKDAEGNWFGTRSIHGKVEVYRRRAA